jgi:hypothetical protein
LDEILERNAQSGVEVGRETLSVAFTELADELERTVKT